MNYSDPATSIWVNRKGVQPKYQPVCGYTGTECPQDLSIYFVIGGAVLFLIVAMAASAVIYIIRFVLQRRKTKFKTFVYILLFCFCINNQKGRYCKCNQPIREFWWSNDKTNKDSNKFAPGMCLVCVGWKKAQAILQSKIRSLWLTRIMHILLSLTSCKRFHVGIDLKFIFFWVTGTIVQ